MGDSYSEVTSVSWFDRIKKSIAGIVGGFVLFVASFGILWWNEGNFVKTKKALEEGAGVTIAVEGTKVNSANEGKLIHMTGQAETTDTVKDGELGFSPTGKVLYLSRTVEMYQWVEHTKEETRDKLGGSQETVKAYEYKKEWSITYQDSDKFDTPEGHRNPAFPVQSQSWRAQNVNVGEYQLPTDLSSKISGAKEVPSNEIKYTSMSGSVRSRLFREGATEKVGDIRISYSLIESPQQVSIIAQQKGNTFTRYQTSIEEKTIFMLDMGLRTKEEMYASAHQANSMMTWLLRLAGFLAMFFGIQLMLAPIAVIADIIPIFGGVVSFGVGLIAAAVSLPLTFITIALAWLRFRPITGIILIIVGVGLSAGVFYLKGMMGKKDKPADGAVA